MKMYVNALHGIIMNRFTLNLFMNNIQSYTTKLICIILNRNILFFQRQGKVDKPELE